jgi:hypothetical protein
MCAIYCLKEMEFGRWDLTMFDFHGEMVQEAVETLPGYGILFSILLVYIYIYI